MTLTGASVRWKAGVAATAILASLQVGHQSLCSSHTCDVLTLYFTNHTSAPSRGFRLMLPLTEPEAQLLFLSYHLRGGWPRGRFLSRGYYRKAAELHLSSLHLIRCPAYRCFDSSA
ncbi:hypothetical protein Y032_0154g3019 [Ancylostoma ceylanicum]|uniref:Uncharacterized protein n=1 Tax=Ancylostoma ceylanicum TaxID=53326 RepID=A0A016T0C9_9BILA|nr:hypothetical protein Y032_0154g3019 [Ancylostoma ceylanicum]